MADIKLVTAAEYNADKCYSVDPVQIGTWLDGTPVWRMAYNYNLQPVDYDDAEGNGDVGIPITLPEQAFYLDVCMLLRTANKPCFIGDVRLSHTAYSYCKLSDDTKNNIRNYTGIYGYVDFVLSADKISEVRPWTSN